MKGLIDDTQIYYYNKFDDPVASLVGGTIFFGAPYVDVGSSKYLPGASRGRFWRSIKGFVPVFTGAVNPHSCDKNNCLGTNENWTVKDAWIYGTDPKRYFRMLATQQQQNKDEQDRHGKNNASLDGGQED